MILMLGYHLSNNVQDKSVDMASDADESMSEISPSAIANNKGFDLPGTVSCLASLNCYFHFSVFNSRRMQFGFHIREQYIFLSSLCIVLASSDGLTDICFSGWDYVSIIGHFSFPPLNR